MKKATEKMKVKRPHWHHQGNYGPNSKVNATNAVRPDINLISAHIIRSKKSTTETSTTTTT